MRRIIYSGLLAAFSNACLATSLPVGEFDDEGSGETGLPDPDSPTSFETEGGAMTSSGDTSDTPASGDSTEAEPNPLPNACEPQVVDEGDGIPQECEGRYVWAWTGVECQQLCECIGPDCDSTVPGLDDCLAPRLDCTAFTESCPMQEGTATLEGATPLTVGTFGRFDDTLVIGFGPTVLDLAGWSHAAFAEFEPSGGTGFIFNLPVPDTTGDYPISGGMLNDIDSPLWTGTLTITELTMDGAPGTWTMSGSLSATSDDGDETLVGDFIGINGCMQLT